MKTTKLALMAAVFFVASLSKADAVVYSNGPGNGTFNSFDITPSSGFSVSDSFTVSSNTTVTGFDLWAWAFSGDTPVSVGWAITSAPLDSGTTYGSGDASLANVYEDTTFVIVTYDVYDSTASGLSVTLAPGTYYLTLSDGVASNGGVGLAWDINNGPSTAFQSVIGNVANYAEPGSNSETFDIYGTPTPEPSSLLLLGTGLLGLWGARRLKQLA